MYIHNIYSDLMIALMSHVDKQLPIQVKSVVFNIANASFSLRKDTQYELPAAIVGLDSVLPYIDHPYVFQHNNLLENYHQQLAVYDYDKDFAVYLQEEYQTLNISLNINCESQIQGFENQRSLISNLPLGKFANYFKFTSFLELDRVLLNSYLIDIVNDRIDNLFLKFNSITNTTEYVFPMEYNPLVKMNSCDLMISDINSTSYQISCSFEILFPSPVYQIYPCLKYLINIDNFNDLTVEKITKPDIKIPIDSDIIYVDITNPITNDKIIPIVDIVQYKYIIPISIRIICFDTNSSEYNYIDNIFIKSNNSFEKQLTIIKNSNLVNIGQINGQIESVNISYVGKIILSNDNIHAKVTIIENLIDNRISGYLYSNVEGSLTSIVNSNSVIIAWFESNDGKIKQEIRFEIDSKIDTEYKFRSITTNMNNSCSLVDIVSITPNDIYSIIEINKYSSKVETIVIKEVVVIGYIPQEIPPPNININAPGKLINSPDLILGSIIYDPIIKSEPIVVPVSEQLPDKIKTPMYDIHIDVNNNTGQVNIGVIDVIPKAELPLHFNHYYILSDGNIMVELCNQLSNQCVVVPIITTILDGTLFLNTNNPDVLTDIYVKRYSTEDKNVTLHIVDRITNQSGTIKLNPENAIIRNDELVLYFKVQYNYTIFNVQIILNIKDSVEFGKIKKYAVQEIIPTPIFIKSTVNLININELATGIIKRINVSIQEFDHSVLSNFTIDDLKLTTSSRNLYKFIITDYILQIDDLTKTYIVEINLAELYEDWILSDLIWTFYFYRADNGSTSKVTQHKDIFLDLLLSTSTKLVFRCTSILMRQYFDFVDKLNIAFLIITR